MIQSFADRATKELFEKENNRRFASVARVALRKLLQMNQAKILSDLAVPPGNRLEGLNGNLSGFHSIRFGKFFGQSEGFWSGLQTEADFRALAKDRKRLTSRIRSASELLGASARVARSVVEVC